MRGRRTLTVLAAAVLVVAACGSPVASPAEAPTDGAPAMGIGGATRYTCGSFPFDAAMWQRAGTAELAGHPAAAALRRHLAAPDEDGLVLPDHGWTLAGIDAGRAEFLAPGDTDDLMYEVSLVQQGGQWRIEGWGQCSPQRSLPPGLNNATWVLAPDEQVGIATTAFTALVTETECASGQSSEGRIVGPEIVELPDRVLVTFAVRQLGDGAHTCQGNPATTVEVRLPLPLGQRPLLDGATLPAREPIDVACCGDQSSGARG